MGEDKKKKPSYLAKAAQLVKSNAVLPKMAGVLGFCPRGKEMQATKELISLLNEYADKLYGEQKGNLNHEKPGDESTSTAGAGAVDSDDDDEGGAEGLSIEDAFAKEVAGFKKGASQRRFKWLTVGIECCIFVKCHESVCPTTLVSTIMKDLFDTKLQKTRFLQRILPAAETCLAFMDQIVPMAQRVLPKYFDGGEPKKFAIIWARRNNDTIERETLIPELASIVTAANPNHSVELKNPDLCIIVEIFKSIVAVSVVERYYEYKKFNLESIHGRNVNNSQNKKNGDGTPKVKGPKTKMIRDAKKPAAVKADDGGEADGEAKDTASESAPIEGKKRKAEDSVGDGRGEEGEGGNKGKGKKGNNKKSKNNNKRDGKKPKFDSNQVESKTE
ncbi:UNVERIFIED_CONTAM: hypothetical protein HDU68_004974 [Siphonaria sp. JEL0065]|nr:hypothetical protein HDU68_004974 [Siphonaria sp. JEL0065]